MTGTCVRKKRSPSAGRQQREGHPLGGGFVVTLPLNTPTSAGSMPQEAAEGMGASGGMMLDPTSPVVPYNGEVPVEPAVAKDTVAV